MLISCGMLAKDVVTGFEGRVTCIASYWTTGDKVLLEPNKLSDEGRPIDSEWFPIERMEVTDANILKLPMPRTDEGIEGVRF